MAILYDVGEGISAEFVRSLGHYVPLYIPNGAICKRGQTRLPHPILPDGYRWEASYEDWINLFYVEEVIVLCTPEEFPNAAFMARVICGKEWADRMDQNLDMIEVPAEREAGREVFATMRNAIMADLSNEVLKKAGS